jgi:hypothetical protein
MRLACMFYNQDFSRKSQDIDGTTRLYSFLTKLNAFLDWQVMNEIALHRGSSPHLNTIDIFVDGQHLTEAVVRRRVLEKSKCVLTVAISPMVSSFPLQLDPQHIRYLQEDLLSIHLSVPSFSHQFALEVYRSVHLSSLHLL